MKHIFPLLLLAIIAYLSSCANQGSPSGGPRDTIPPTFLSANPPHKSLNYKKREFEFEFDERINADQLRTKMNITPFTENRFKVLVKKNILNIVFDDYFEDSTTYTFNFADGVGDITEKNPVINFTYAFSTGPIIDSIYVNGTVRDLYNNEQLKEILIALYSIEDSLNLFTGKPRYFTQTDEEGHFQIENIKTGKYRLYAYEDQDKNLKNNPQKEKHGFIADTLDLYTSKDSLSLTVQLIDASEPKFVRAKNTGQYFDVLYNKYMESYDIRTIDTMRTRSIPAHSFFKENTIIRFYPDGSMPIEKDSLQVQINSTDSLGNHLTDTVFVQFKSSKRKPETFNFSYTPDTKFKIQNSIKFKLNFSKPIAHTNYDSITIAYDTLQSLTIVDSIATWNINKTILTFETNLDKNYIPNQMLLLEQELLLEDSIARANQDPNDTTLATIPPVQFSPLPNQILFKIKPAAFISIDQDTSEVSERKYEFLKPENTGQISGEIETTIPNFSLQLVDPKFNVIAQVRNETQFKFTYVPPGKYTFRMLVDSNNDGKWNPGNILKNIEPEPTVFYPETMDLKAGWEIELFKTNKLVF
ncbi:MAG: Ig-like domain-containing domain [Cyclobacteriaceae bacterium]